MCRDLYIGLYGYILYIEHVNVLYVVHVLYLILAKNISPSNNDSNVYFVTLCDAAEKNIGSYFAKVQFTGVFKCDVYGLGRRIQLVGCTNVISGSWYPNLFMMMIINHEVFIISDYPRNHEGVLAR